MPSLNKVILLGNITRDIELRYSPHGTAITTISLATTRKWRGTDDQQKEETTFVDVVVFGRQAENAKQYLAKGRSVLIEGRLKFEQWTDKQTNKPRSKLAVVADHVHFLGHQEAPQEAQQPAPLPSQAPAPTPVPATAEPAEDDVPF